MANKEDNLKKIADQKAQRDAARGIAPTSEFSLSDLGKDMKEEMADSVYAMSPVVEKKPKKRRNKVRKED